MIQSQISRLSALLAGPAVVIAVHPSLAPHAGADTNDAAYLQTLAKRGITCSNYDCGSSGDAALINLAHSACAMINNGDSPVDVAILIAGITKGVSQRDAAYIFGAGVNSYCPWNASKIP